MTHFPDRHKAIGVIIPAFNEAENLLRVLNVVCAMDWVEQIVVVDDGSTDDTLNVARQSAVRDKRVIGSQST